MTNSQSKLQRNAVLQNANNSSVPASPQQQQPQQQQQQQQQQQNHGNSNVHPGGVHPNSVMQPGTYGFYPPPYFNNGPYIQQGMPPNMYHQPPNPLHHPHQHSGAPQSQQGQQNTSGQTPQQQQQQSGNQQQTPQAQNAMSPSNSRKRRASEIDDSSLPPSMTMSPYAMQPHQSLMTPQQTGSGGAAPSPIMVTNAPQPMMKVDTAVSNQTAGETGSPSQDNNKKGRTNTPWTPQEEGRLKSMRDEGASWSVIAKTFPQRTEGSVKKHWYKDMHFENVSKVDEGNFAIKDYENNKWKAIGQKLGKQPKQCEQYAKEHGLVPSENA